MDALINLALIIGFITFIVRVIKNALNSINIKLNTPNA